MTPSAVTRFTDDKALPLFLSADDIGTLFGRSRRTAERWMASGQLGVCKKLGGARYIHRKVLLDAVKKGEPSTAPKPQPRRPRSIAVRRGRPR